MCILFFYFPLQLENGIGLSLGINCLQIILDSKIMAIINNKKILIAI